MAVIAHSANTHVDRSSLPAEGFVRSATLSKIVRRESCERHLVTRSTFGVAEVTSVPLCYNNTPCQKLLLGPTFVAAHVYFAT
jgi:hypothetical protein